MQSPQAPSLTPTANTLGQLRQTFLVAVSIIGIVTAGSGLIAQFFIDTGNLSNTGILAVFLAAIVTTFVLAQRGFLHTASYLAIILFTLAAVMSPMAILILGGLALISAATLSSRRIFILVNLIVITKAVIDAIQAWQTAQADMTIGIRIISVLTLILISFSARFLITYTQSALAAASRSTNLLQAVAEIGQILAKLLSLTELLNRAVELIQERLVFYHVQVFLLDENDKAAHLVASTGEIGQLLLKRQHQLAVGSQSVIGQVTMLGRPVIVRDTDQVYHHNELLPDTRTELAVPILDGERIIGALDVQSRTTDAFDADRVQALQVMANLLGNSIRNARLFEQQERGATETKRLYLETETNLREIQRLNQQLTRQGWQEYLQGRQTSSSGVTLENNRFISEDTWSDSLIQATRNRQPVTLTREDGHSIVALPVVLGNEVIGAVEVETEQPLSKNETIEMMRAISQRLAISLDKARLFEESQESTAQEQRINEIVARYQTVSNVDDLLQITLTELSQTLGATRGAIRLSLTSQGEVAG
ncbi:MAG TPA: GAF domain-containing protein [Phototrophicaceae bacterium]|nr:GAF domain-containing protein [Phototrophicaceae bacterium]